MIFELAKDFSDAIAAMPREHPKHRILRLLAEAIRRDIHFIARHPTTLFQCMWNTCWWYDCTEASHHYDPPSSGWPSDTPPWESTGPKMYLEAEGWEQRKSEATPGFRWFRSSRPPPVPLNQSLRTLWRVASRPHALAVSPDRRRIAVVSQEALVVIDPLSYANECELRISLQTPVGDFITQTLPLRFLECIWFDEHRIATSDGASSRIQIWNLRTGALSAIFSLDTDSTLSGGTTAWSGLTSLQSGRLLAASRVTPLQFMWNRSRTNAFPSWLEGSSVPPSITCVWSTETGQPIALFRLGRACSVVSLSKDGELLAIAWDRTIVVYHVGKWLNANRLCKVSAGLGGLVEVDLTEATVLFRCELHRAEIASISFLNDGQRLAVVEPYGRVELYNVFSGERCWVSSTQNMFSKTDLVGLTPADDDTFLVSLWRKLVYLMNVTDGTVRCTLWGARSNIESASVIKDSTCIIALTDSELLVWDAEKNDPYFLKGTGDPGFAVFNPETAQLVSESANTMIWWDVKTGRMLREARREISAWIRQIVGRYRGEMVAINTSEKPPISGFELIDGRFEQRDEAILIRNGSQHIGWLPHIRFFTSHPDGNLVAGSIGDDVCLYQLVGVPAESGSSEPSSRSLPKGKITSLP